MAESKQPDVLSDETRDYPCLYSVNPKRSNKKIFWKQFLETGGATALSEGDLSSSHGFARILSSIVRMHK